MRDSVGLTYTMDQINHDDIIVECDDHRGDRGKNVEEHCKGKMQNKNDICFISSFLSLQIIMNFFVVTEWDGIPLD